MWKRQVLHVYSSKKGVTSANSHTHQQYLAYVLLCLPLAPYYQLSKQVNSQAATLF